VDFRCNPELCGLPVSGEMLVNIGGSGHCVKTLPQEGIQAAERDTRTTIV